MGLERIAELKATLGEHGEVLVAYLFGSAARDEMRRDSDVDVAVLVDRSSVSGPSRPTLASMQVSLQADLESAVRRPVDLVVLNHASPDLIHRVLRDGVILVERDRSARIRFEVDARNAYFDVLPFLNRYREAALR